MFTSEALRALVLTLPERHVKVSQRQEKLVKNTILLLLLALLMTFDYYVSYVYVIYFSSQVGAMYLRQTKK